MFIFRKNKQYFKSQKIQFIIYRNEIYKYNFSICLGKVRCKESDSKIRNGKKQGSCKINRMCTSQIIISQNTKVNGITAQYFPTHYGHELDIQHVRIPKLERENIAAKLKLGTSVSR